MKFVVYRYSGPTQNISLQFLDDQTLESAKKEMVELLERAIQDLRPLEEIKNESIKWLYNNPCECGCNQEKSYDN